MACDHAVLVVGTTPDYIDWINQRWPGRAVFLTDTKVRQQAEEPAVDARSEMLCDLRRFQRCREAITAHLQQFGRRLTGIMCFDCETMSLTARLADCLGLPYPSLQSIELCQDKFRCKQKWRSCDVPCPEVRLLKSPQEAASLPCTGETPWVVKPINATGSELVFLCRDGEEAQAAAERIFQKQLKFVGQSSSQETLVCAVAESYSAGEEYSCDLVIKDNQVRIVRVAKKLRLDHRAFGITRGYVVPATLPESVTIRGLEKILLRAAKAVGLVEAICMVDFIVGAEGVSLLEFTPRPGGDCLPHTIRQSASLDMLGLALDVAEGHYIHLPSFDEWRPMVGVRIYAQQAGRLRNLDLTAACRDARVREHHLFRHPGWEIALPPDDYDSWILGHIIFEPHPEGDIASQCDELTRMVCIDIEDNHR